MAKKTFRTIYLSDELEEILQKQAEKEQSSVSRLVRIALQKHLKTKGTGVLSFGNDNNPKSTLE